ncbi:hypothetical protein QUF72_16130 [Desulfobacterales bacterium HSG2]|nr:hypothetical protein [Desulfobacterales bacterium HSG2]
MNADTRRFFLLSACLRVHQRPDQGNLNILPQVMNTPFGNRIGCVLSDSSVTHDAVFSPIRIKLRIFPISEPVSAAALQFPNVTTCRSGMPVKTGIHGLSLMRMCSVPRLFRKAGSWIFSYLLIMNR